MKKVVFALCAGVMLLGNACNKDIGGLPANSWSVSGKTFTATSVKVSAATSYITAADGKGSSLDLSFRTLPSSSADFSTNDAAYTSNDVVVRTVLSGNIIYNSVPGTGGFVSVRVNGGKYTVIMNDVKLVNFDKASDTVKVSSNIIEM